MSENETPADDGQQEQTFTQADVDRLVGKARTEERRKASEKFADYDDLKATAEGAKTAEQRIADLEKRLSDADAREQRSKLVARIAGEHKISDPDDIRLFLTGSDEDTLTEQAKRLADRDATRRKKGDVLPDVDATPEIKTSPWSATLARLDARKD